ncbi:hypothetical protein Hanom_Chr02g00173061 [Helianthus anomalus]
MHIYCCITLSTIIRFLINNIVLVLLKNLTVTVNRPTITTTPTFILRTILHNLFDKPSRSCSLPPPRLQTLQTCSQILKLPFHQKQPLLHHQILFLQPRYMSILIIHSVLQHMIRTTIVRINHFKST